MQIGIKITGAQDSRDQKLFKSYFGEGAKGQDIQELVIEQAYQLERNKLSLLPCHEDYVNNKKVNGAIHDLIMEQLDKQRRWQELLAMVGLLLEHHESYRILLMKALLSPFALMSDVDLLVPQPLDIASLACELEEAGFELYRFRLFAHPLKIMAAPKDHVQKGLPSVDLYPDAMWMRKHVIDGLGVVARRRKQTIRGVQIWTPCPEDDLYLVATHAFAHCNITLAELDHGERLIRQEPFDWSQLLHSAASFGCQDGVYTYLRLLVCACQSAGIESHCPSEVIIELESTPACQAVKRWLDIAEQELTLPIRVPLWLGTVHSARYHLPAVRQRICFSELIMDAVIHGFNIGVYILRNR
jgi:hypothetical protein